MHDHNHFVADITLKAVLEHRGKILMTSGDGKRWELPGGRLNNGEQPVAGVVREISEELGVDVEPTGILDAFAFVSSAGNNHLAVVYRCHPMSDINKIRPNDGEIVDMRWITQDEVDQLTMWPQYKTLLHRLFDRTA